MRCHFNGLPQPTSVFGTHFMILSIFAVIEPTSINERSCSLSWGAAPGVLEEEDFVEQEEAVKDVINPTADKNPPKPPPNQITHNFMELANRDTAATQNERSGSIPSITSMPLLWYTHTHTHTWRNFGFTIHVITSIFCAYTVVCVYARTRLHYSPNSWCGNRYAYCGEGSSYKKRDHKLTRQITEELWSWLVTRGIYGIKMAAQADVVICSVSEDKDLAKYIGGKSLLSTCLCLRL